MILNGMQVRSSAIAAIRYQPRGRRLLVVFRSGEQYAYDDVPGEVHAAFVSAPSKGRFFQDNVRDRYGYRRLGR